jgi:hypothetical protein
MIKNWALDSSYFLPVGPKKGEVTGDWRKLHNEELHLCTPCKYYCSDKIEKDEMGR